MDNVFVENAILQGWADTIREKTGTDEKMKPDVLLQKTQELGSGAEDLFPLIDAVTFSYDGLKNHYTDITLNLVNARTIAGLIDNKPIMFNKLTVTISEKCTTFQNAFRGSSVTDTLLKNLKTIVINGDTSKVTTFINAFMGRIDLEEIIGELNFTSSLTNSNTFSNCEKLVTVRVVKESIRTKISFAHCAELSMKSADSIIDGLAYVEETQILSLPNHIKLQLTDARKAQITSKNWTLA